MRRLISIGIVIIVALMVLDFAIGATGSRLLKEIPGVDQTVKYVNGIPVITSKKEYSVGISPKSILNAPKISIKFYLTIYNPGNEPLPFSIQNIRVFSGEKNFPILLGDQVVKEVKNEFSAEKMRLSKEQEKALQPYVEDKMQRLRESLLKDQVIAPQKKAHGLIAIDLPLGLTELNIEVAINKDIHIFSFNIFDL